MGKINFTKVLLGGIAGGIAVFIVGGIVHMGLFKGVMEPMMAKGMVNAASTSTLIPEFILDVIIATLGTYVYALARPRLGASYASAIQVSIVVGLLLGLYSGGGVMIWMTEAASNSQLPLLHFVAGFLGPAVGTFVGAWIYTD